MDCRDCAKLAAAWLDGELDPATTVEFERHVRECAACDRRTESLRSLAGALRSAELYVRAPEGLEAQVRAALDRERRGRSRWWMSPARWTSAAAAVLLAGLVGWMLHQVSTVPRDRLAREVVSAHVRSLMAEHLLDVASSDRHTVKPWFAGKLDFSPDVRDFAAEGFPLVGGRLEYLDGHPAAALVYRHGDHTINLFTWPVRAEKAPVAREINGYQTLRWSSESMEYFAVSDSSENALRGLAQCLNGEPASPSL